MIFTPRRVLTSLLATSLIGCGGSGSDDNKDDNGQQEAAICSQDTANATDSDRDWTCMPEALQGKVMYNSVIQNDLNCSTTISGSGDVSISVTGTLSASLTVSNADARQHSQFTSTANDGTYRVWIGDPSYNINQPHIEFTGAGNSNKVYVEAYPLKASDGAEYKATCVMDVTAQSGGGNTGPVISREEFIERYTLPVLMDDGTWAPCTNSLALKAFGIAVGTPAAFINVESLRFLPGAEGTITAPR